ncbi:serine/threonine-protein kinase [Mycobacterium sp. 1164985.4]|uniref:serine/threonine-protein kinase n=1 Tax=Mycobacterium sp. 1164985.4 TaxID=1834069 RepID=UPI00336A8C87
MSPHQPTPTACTQLMPLRIGEAFAGYRVLRLLGSGGMGEVYLVQHPRLPRQEALKVLRSDLSSDESFRERFVREADLAAGLRHPHIVGVHDRGEHDGHLWIAMDYIDGTDAAQLLAQKYPAGMPIDLAVRIVSAVGSALDYAHKKGLLHRDVKPANIIVADLDSDEPDVYLADFGIARQLDDVSGITTTNMTVGTVAYSAPEQLMGEPMDGRADQYALAATTFHLLAGSQPFPNSNPAVVISRHLNAPVPALAGIRPELASLDPILAASLAKNANDRFVSCTDFATAITESAGPKNSQHAAPTTPAPVALPSDVTPAASKTLGATTQNSPVGSPTRWVIAVSVVALLLAVVAGALWRPWQQQSPQSDHSATPTQKPSTTSLPTAVTTPTSPAPAAAPPPSPTSSSATPTVVRTPTVPTPGDELPNIDGADWAGYARAMEQELSPEGYDLMFGVTFTDSAAWVCDWDTQGADQAAVEDRLVDKYHGLSYEDARVIYRSAMDWICPVAGPELTPSGTATSSSNPNGPGCSSQRPDKCGPWTPEQAAFACRAVAGGADYVTDLTQMLMNRYGLDENSAFFLGKEAWYSVSSGGYINTGSMADGPHPLCNDVIPS